MTPKNTRTAACDANARKGRLAADEGFWSGAQDLTASGAAQNHAIATLYVHAGIAASDVICCALLGKYSRSGNHADALALLAQAMPELRPPLQRLIGMKTLAGYGAEPVSTKKLSDARTAAEKLMSAARLV